MTKEAVEMKKRWMVITTVTALVLALTAGLAYAGTRWSGHHSSRHMVSYQVGSTSVQRQGANWLGAALRAADGGLVLRPRWQLLVDGHALHVLGSVQRQRAHHHQGHDEAPGDRRGHHDGCVLRQPVKRLPVAGRRPSAGAP